MRQLKNLNIFVICSILLFIDKTSGLGCWRCSSDASKNKFCGETLEPSELNEQQKWWSYVHCPDELPPIVDVLNVEKLITKCRISLQLVNDIPTYIRDCFWEEENVPSNSCAIQNHRLSFVKMVACNTCNEDGCNVKLLSASEEKDNKTISANYVNNSAVFAVLSNAIFVLFIISTVIKY